MADGALKAMSRHGRGRAVAPREPFAPSAVEGGTRSDPMRRRAIGYGHADGAAAAFAR